MLARALSPTGFIADPDKTLASSEGMKTPSSKNFLTLCRVISDVKAVGTIIMGTPICVVPMSFCCESSQSSSYQAASLIRMLRLTPVDDKKK